MNKIVREHYPVDKLPEDLRRLFPGQSEVTLEITAAGEGRSMSGADAVAMLRRLGEPVSAEGRTMSDIVRDVRSLRDEWDS
jgi:hypothetical protein